MSNGPYSRFYKDTNAQSINTSEMGGGTIFYPVFVNTSGNASNQIPYNSSNVTYDNVGGVFGVDKISTDIVVANQGVSIIDSGALNLLNTALNYYSLNMTSSNVLDFSYLGSSKATLTSTGTFKGVTLQASSQINCNDTTAGLTANVTYITRGNGITYIGSTVSGTPTNELIIESGRTVIRQGRLDLIDQGNAAQYSLETMLSGILYQQIYIGSVKNVWYGNDVNFAIQGNLFAASYSISCRNRKQNIEDLSLDYCSDLILKLKPKKYQYKKMYDASGKETTRFDIDRKTSFGFIAQEVKEDICGCEDLNIHQPGDGNLFPQALSYTELIAPLVKVVQDLMKKNEDLTQRVIQLESSLRTI